MTRIVAPHALLALLILFSPPADAQQLADALITHEFDIPSQGVDTALEHFQTSTGVRVSYIAESLKSFYSNTVRGRFTAPEALELMLGAEGIDIEWVAHDAVYVGLMTRTTVRRFKEAGIAAYDGMGASVTWPIRIYPLMIDRMPLSDLIEPLSYYFGLRFQIPPSDEAMLRTYVGPLNGMLTAEGTLDYLLNDTTLAWERVDERTVRIHKRSRSERPDVMVEASRLFTLTSDQPPSGMLTKEEIGRLGVTSVAQAMQYLAQQPFSHFEGLRTDGAQGVQLRGLGFDTTLVLINGHPVGSTANLYDTNAFDLNTIPLTAVERIEVWLDATPLSVGADAIGGMLNIALKSDAQPPSLDLHYGSAEGGARERRASLTAGISREGLRLTTVLDYFTRDELSGAARDRWRNQDYRRFGGNDFRSPDANPGNVASLTSDNLPGLPARFAAVPRRHQPSKALSVDDFLSTAGQRNLESLFAYRSIVPDAQRSSVLASADWRVAPRWRAFGELLYTARENVFDDIPSSVSNGVVPASNPHNPFEAPVRSNFLLTAIEHERSTRTAFGRGLIGMQGQFDGWSAKLTLLKTDDRGTLKTEGDLDPARLLEVLAQSDPQQALNVFDTGAGGPHSLLDGLVAAPVTRRYRSEYTEGAVELQAELFELPAGPVAAELGAQWRLSEISVADVSLPIASRRALSAFSALHVPLLGAESSAPDLSTTLQARIDRHSDLGTTIHSQVRLDWRPARDLALRGTFGTNFRAPSLYELYQPIVTLPARVPDPRRENELANVAVSFGGNPELKPATAESWSLGLTLTPESWRRLSLSMTYWHTRVEDRLSPVERNALLANEDLFPGRVVRGAPTASDRALGRPGAIIALDFSSGAGGRLRASGVDVRASVTMETRWGRITPELAATWIDEFSVADWPGLPRLNRVNVASLFGTIPRWRGIAGVEWARGNFTLSTKARLNSSYEDVDPALNQKTGRHVDPEPQVDIQASLRLDRDVRHAHLWRDVSITTGVLNVFDRSPPFAVIGANFGFDTSQADLRERFGYLRVTKDF